MRFLKAMAQMQVTFSMRTGQLTDYDTIWTVTIDANGNLTVENDLCEGIDSDELPEQAPQF